MQTNARPRDMNDTYAEFLTAVSDACYMRTGDEDDRDNSKADLIRLADKLMREHAASLVATHYDDCTSSYEFPWPSWYAEHNTTT